VVGAAPDELLLAVAALAGWTYEAKGLAVTSTYPILNIAGVMVPTLNRIEAVVTDDFKGAIETLRVTMAEAIGEVWILAPLPNMGAAHAALRGRVDRLVPWWVEGTTIKFGNPRIP
jgi:hypothetical protein